MPSETFYKPVKAICADGVIRTCRVKCYWHDGSFASDTFFSVPAYVKAKGKTIRGYVTGIDPEENNGMKYSFRAYLYRKNHAYVANEKDTSA
jgi:hypothetical protein